MRSFRCHHFDSTLTKRVQKLTPKRTCARTHFWNDFGSLFWSCWTFSGTHLGASVFRCFLFFPFLIQFRPQKLVFCYGHPSKISNNDMSHTSDFQLRFWTRFGYNFSRFRIHFSLLFRNLFLYWFFDRFWFHFRSKNGLSELRQIDLGSTLATANQMFGLKDTANGPQSDLFELKGNHLDVFSTSSSLFWHDFQNIFAD